MNNSALNVVVVGAGMYVCGKNTDGFGTILPVLLEEQNKGSINEIHIAGTQQSSIKIIRDKIKSLNRMMDIRARVCLYPIEQKSSDTAYKEALKLVPRPAVAIISVPDHLHALIAQEVILAGIPPLMVKPFTPTVKEGVRLIKLLKEKKIYGAVEFHKRFDEANLVLKQKNINGNLGEICYINVEFSQRRKIRDIFSTWINHTNIFQYLGVHYVDLVYFIFGAKPIRVMATAQGTRGKNGSMIYDSIQAVIEWEVRDVFRKFISIIQTNWIDPESTSAMSEQKILVVGTKGRIQSDQKRRGLQMVSDDGGIEDINPYFTQIYSGQNQGERVSGYGPKSIRCFLKDIKDINNGRITIAELRLDRPTFTQGLISTSVVQAVYHSLTENNNWIFIKDILDLDLFSQDLGF